MFQKQEIEMTTRLGYGQRNLSLMENQNQVVGLFNKEMVFQSKNKL